MTPEHDEPITLYPDRTLAIGLAVAAVGLIGLGAWLTWKGGTTVGVAVASLGLFVLIGALVWMIPSRAYLHVGDRAFSYSCSFLPKRVEWADVDRFGVATVDGKPRVAWNFASHYPADVFDRDRTKKQTGFETILPSQCCRHRPESLVDLLNRRKEKATA